MKQGRIVIISGPSGSGKTTLHDKLLCSKKFKGKLVRSVSATTRLPRAGEREGREYFFLNKREFLARKKKGLFLESMKVFDNYYGTPKDRVEQVLKSGKNILLCIDVKGAAEVSRKCPDAVKIFIKTPTLADLKHRLSHRGTENVRDLQLRLKIAQKELKEVKKYDHVVVNDRLSRAQKELEGIIQKETRG